MLKNVYAPLSAGVAQERVMEILANNMANTNTTGFKEDNVSFASMLADPWPSYRTELPPAPFKLDMRELHPLHGSEMEYAALSEVKTDHRQGALQKTGNPLDFALEGKGFFSVMTPFGERFTRDGSFSLSPEGVLMTKGGFAVQGENGALTGLKEGNVKVLSTGEVYVGDRFVDKMKTTSFSDEKLLQRLGSNLWVHDGPQANQSRGTAELSQGYVEGSNVNPMRNLTNLITAHRTYEALQKAVKAHDESMGLSANKIGEVQG